MFGTLHQSQPSFAFFLKRSEQKTEQTDYSYKHVVFSQVQTGQYTLKIYRDWCAGGHTVA